MPDYSKSKIYIIKSDQTDKIFVGATTKALCSRMAQHRKYYQNFINKLNNKIYESSFDIVKFSDARIQLVESFTCNDKDELNLKLQNYIDSYKDLVINKPKEKKVKIKQPKEKQKKENTTLPIEQPKEEVIKNENIIDDSQTESDYKTSDEEINVERKEEIREAKEEFSLMPLSQRRRMNL